MSFGGNAIVIGAPNEDAVSFDEGRVYVFQNSIVSGGASPDNTSMNYFPNPTSGMLRVNSDVEMLSFQILSIEGRVCHSGKVNSTHELKIDFPELTNGVYFLKIQTQQNERTFKFIKK
jgi:hypothetical protein